MKLAPHALTLLIALAGLATSLATPCDLASYKPDPTRVNTAYGKLNGACNNVAINDPDRPDRTGNVLSWIGVPFAKPPIGDLRFMRPQPPAFWTERDAKSPKPVCAQIDTVKGFTQSEDCLYLNVYAPLRNNTKTLLPVYVYIHGGSFVTGAALKLNPTAAVAFSGDIIFVTIDYRLGPFGFMYLPELDIPGNMGFLDQNLALKWIYENIKNFGGDPKKITLGEFNLTRLFTRPFSLILK
jgi:carboxylesterase type B